MNSHSGGGGGRQDTSNQYSQQTGLPRHKITIAFNLSYSTEFLEYVVAKEDELLMFSPLHD